MFAIVMLMPFAVITCLIVISMEIALWLPANYNRQIWASLTLSLLLPSGIYTAFSYFNWYALVFLVITAYRAVNLGRYILRRRQADHLYLAVKRASSWLIIAQLISLGLLITATQLSLRLAGEIAVTVSFVGSLILAWSTQRNLRTTRPTVHTSTLREAELPTLSVLIPARNETDDLISCLQTLIKSTYPKLEIIVLDDRSQNKRTPEIIKDFAHDGVRFIAGKETPAPWLAKNFAYQQLSEVASGELILFCGVDTRFAPETLGLMVEELIQNKKTMLSFMPANVVPKAGQFESLFVQPSRYAWELALPRRVLERPPVLSTAWLIRHATLRASGGFKAVVRAATPERYFARFSATHNDGYRFLQSDSQHGLTCLKSFDEQRSTSIRTRYPQLHQSLELTALTSSLELLILVGPFIAYINGLFGKVGLQFAVADIACITLITAYAQISNVTYRRFLVRSLWLLPFAAIYDVALLNYSMYRYEFSTVEWKGRNAALPVMQVVERLPKIDG